MSPDQRPSPRGRGNVWRHCHHIWEGVATGIYRVGTRDIAKSCNLAQDGPPPQRTAQPQTSTETRWTIPAPASAGALSIQAAFEKVCN